MLGKVTHGYEGHIHQHLRHQPTGLHRKVTQNQRTQHTEGIAQGIRRIQRCQLQHIYKQLHQQKLQGQGHGTVPLHQEEIPGWGQARRICDQKIPKGRNDDIEEHDKKANDTQVGAHQGRKIVVIDLLVKP